MRTVAVEWTAPDLFDVRVDGASLTFTNGRGQTTVSDAEHFVSWSAWGKPGTPYAFEVFVDDASVYRSRRDARIGRRQVAFGVITIRAVAP